MKISGAELPDHVVLDTSAYSHLARRAPQVIDVVASASVITLPVTVVGELEAGFQLGNRYRENQRALAEFLAEPFVRVANVDRDVAIRYGTIFSSLKSAGTPIPTNDIWIAAATFCTGGHLLTYDNDFLHVEGLAHTLLISEPTHP